MGHGRGGTGLEGVWGWGTGTPQVEGSSGCSQGPAAGGETVTITEFSNGNGSADG